MSSQPSQPPPFASVDGLLRELAREPEPAPPSPPEVSLPAGTRIGRFELLREIGRGGLGVVYEARDLSLGRSVAFKLVRGGPRAELRRDRLVREAAAAARLSHPNVVTLHDLGSSEHGPYLVLELLRGETLAARVGQGPVPVPEALDLAIGVASGLAHAHEEGVIHGDVTPGNVFLCHDGRVKLLDLGLAHLFGSPSSGGGTRGFMAPELRGGAPPSERSDVFGLGVVLFRAVTGHMPYRADDDRGRPRLKLAEAPSFADAIERMISTDASDRPAGGAGALACLTAAREELTRAAVVRPAGRRAKVLVAAGLAFFALVAGGLGLRGRGDSRSPPPGGLMSVAVLPFADRSPDHDQRYLAEGVADHLLGALTRVETLRVMGRASSFSLGDGATPELAARRLGVTRVLTGTTRRVGDRLEVAAELRDDRGATVWAQRYDRPIGDIFAIQDDIERKALLALGVTPAAARAAPAPVRSSDAYNELLKGRQQHYRGTVEGFKAARDAFERATAIDAGSAEAWAGLAIILTKLSETTGPYTAEEVRSLRDRSVSAVEKAVALDPKLAEAWAVRAMILGPMKRDWPRAIADVDRALALDPNSVSALVDYSLIHATFGHSTDAIAAAEKAADRDPLSTRPWAALAAAYASARRLADDERTSRRLLEISPTSLSGLVGLGGALLVQGKTKEALAVYARCPEPYILTGTAMAEHTLGHPEASRAALEKLEKRYATSAPSALVQVHAWRGDNDAAFKWLERGLATGDREVAAIRLDPLYAGLEKDPRYPAMLKKLGLPVP